MWCFEHAHISDIGPGATVLHAGELRTISKSSIGGDSFVGRTIFGDSYRGGFDPVIIATSKSRFIKTGSRNPNTIRD